MHSMDNRFIIKFKGDNHRIPFILLPHISLHLNCIQFLLSKIKKNLIKNWYFCSPRNHILSILYLLNSLSDDAFIRNSSCLSNCLIRLPVRLAVFVRLVKLRVSFRPSIDRRLRFLPSSQLVCVFLLFNYIGFDAFRYSAQVLANKISQ